MKISPDGATLMLVGATSLRLLRLETGQVNPFLDDEKIGNFVFSGDGRYLAVNSDWTMPHLKVFEVATGGLLWQFPGPALTTEEWLGPLAASPDGQTLVSAVGNDIVFWDMATGVQRRRLRGHTHSVVALSLSANGRILASGSWDDTVLVWEVADLLKVKPPTARPLTAVALEECWVGLMQPNAAAAQKCMEKLTAVGTQTVDLLRQRLKVAALDPRAVQRAIAQLNLRTRPRSIP